jgi:signal transduction histidine kinase/tetratricopeptide (TPR) repeat protein
LDGRNWTGEHPLGAGGDRAMESGPPGTKEIHKPATDTDTPFADPLLNDPGLYEGRFEARGVLKDGPSGTTLEGFDRQSGEPIIIKSVPASSVARAAQVRLEHEGMVLRSLHHNCIVPLVHMGRDHGHIYVVTPQLDGEDLGSRLLRRGPLSVSETLLVLRDVLAGLGEAHGVGVLHRDVRPDNILVNATDITGARLVDFGLSWSHQLDAVVRDAHVGTARYMAPEQAGLIDRPISEASDLYAVGALAYECLLGTPAFDAKTMGEVLRQHLSARPRRLRSLGLPIPRALDEIIQRLLRSDPRERYQTAQAAAGDLERLSARMAQGDPDPAVVLGLGDRRDSLTEADFVGRATELAQLRDQLSRAKSGAGALTFVSALSGGGKTRLLWEAVVGAEQDGLRVFQGQATDLAARLPLQIFSGVISTIHGDPELAQRVRARLGDAVEAVCEVFPELVTVLRPREEVLPGREEHGAARTSLAIAQLLHALGDQGRPAVVILDDCQWADEQSVEVLTEWRRTWEEGQTYVAVVASYRSEEVAPDAPLLGLRKSGHVQLAPLSASSVRALAESMAGKLPEVALDALVRLSEGSPFLATALLRGLVEMGALKRREGAWAMEADALADIQSSRRAAVLLSRRLDLLPADALDALTLCAVLGKEFRLADAARLHGGAIDDLSGPLMLAAERHIVWVDAATGRGAFVHDKLREALLERLEPEKLRATHLRAAESLEQAEPESVYALAYHFDAAGAVDRALPYAVAAAEQARQLHGLEVAERHYRIALAAGSLGGQTLRVVHQGLGTVLMLRGEYGEASALLQKAREGATGRYQTAIVDARLGELAFKRGDMAAASVAIERGLRGLGRYVPRTTAAFLVLVAWEGAVQVMHTLAPRLFCGRRTLEGAEEQLLAVRLYSRLAYPYWFQHGIVRALWTLLREVNQAERYPDCAELAQAYANHGVAMTVPGFFDRGVAYAQRGLEMRRSLHDLWGQGQSQAFLGIVFYAAARVREAEAAGREAVRLLERTGDRWEYNTASYHVGLSLLRQGRFAEALAIGRRLHRDGCDGGDMQAIGEGVEIWSKATGGRIPVQVVERELDRHLEDKQTRSLVLQAEAMRQLGCDDLEGAVTTLEKAMEIGRDLQSDYVAPVPCWLATARRRLAATVPAWAPARRKELLAQATKAARAGYRRARRYQNNLPHALREMGLLSAMQGRPDAARGFLDKSLAEAERLGAPYEAAQTRHARGTLGQDLGWEGAFVDAEAGQAAVRSMTVLPANERRGGPSLSLVDRFSTLLDVGRQVATALTRDDVYAATMDAATTLLRAETCSVLALEGDTVTAVVGEVDKHVSTATVRRALTEGGTVLASADVGVSSAATSEVHSALCVPVQVRGERSLCIYATTSQFAGIYGVEEERLAEFVATIAGAALENAMALEELGQAQDQLVHSGKLAAVGTLMAGLSHEINNPLAVVIGFAQTLLVTTPPTHPDHAALEAIEREAQRCARLVQTLLTFSRNDVGHQEYVPVSHLFRSVPDLLAGRARRRRVDLRVGDGRGLPPVYVNVTAVESCLINLVKNSLDATAPGGKVSVDAQVATRQGQLGVTVTVEDNGSGIDKELLPRIFEPFFTTKEAGRGTGLGLSLVRKIVDAHDGHVEMTSELGVGTCARLWFPAAGQS